MAGRGGGLSFKIVVHDREVRDGLRRSRKEIKGDIRDSFQERGEQIILPRARRNAPGFVGSTLTIRATLSGARLTTSLRGGKRGAAGLLEWGGTVRTTLEPKSARGLFLEGAGGIVRARVTAPRKYKGKAYMRKAVKRGRRRFLRAVQRDITRKLEARMAGLR